LDSIKILHCADFHFDSPFRELPGSLGEKRKEDLRETFGQMVRVAQEENIHLLLISGDLFDNERVSRMTIDYLRDCLQEIPQIRVFIAPGNHDPFYERSYYRLVDWPENVHVFQDEGEKIELCELGVCVYGRGFMKPHVRESLLQGFTVADPAKLNLMVLHGDVVGTGQDSDYNPLTTEEIAASGLDYLALGHRHSFSGINQAGDTFWAYPGCPEGRAFDELGEKGVLLGTLRKGRCQLSFRGIGKRKYYEERIEISGCQTYEQIAAKIRAAVEGLEPEKNLFRLVLSGALPGDFPFYPAVLTEKLQQDFYYVQIIDETMTQVDPQLLANDYTLRGLFVQKALARSAAAQEEAERRKAELALKYGLRILEQGEAGIE
jgi:exonuclease SbcD